MNNNWLILIGATLMVGVVSYLIAYFRSETLTSPADLASKDLMEIRKGNTFFYGLFLPGLVGALAFSVYRSLLIHSPETAQTTFLYLSIGIGLVLTILAAIVFRRRGFFELTVLHILYSMGFGWLSPMLWVR